MMIRSVVVSMLPPYEAAALCMRRPPGLFRNTTMAHSVRAHNEAAQLIGFRPCGEPHSVVVSLHSLTPNV
jgi:hypothetical protein